MYCSRYGGTLLGPVRFTHIENCTREVCQKFKAVEEVRECIDTLRSLDAQLADLRAQLASPNSPSPSQSSQPPNSQPEPTPSQSSQNSGLTTTSDPETKKRKRDPEDEGPDGVASLDAKNERAKLQAQAKPPPDYEKMLLQPEADVEKARRLVKARQASVKSVEAILARSRTTTEAQEAKSSREKKEAEEG